MMYTAFDPTNIIHVKYFKDMPCNIASDTRGVVAMSNKGTIGGMIALDNWTENSVFGHIKVTSPMCLREGGLIAEVTDFVFRTAGREIIFAPIRSDNAKAINIVEKIGFVEEARLKDAHEHGVDMVMFRLDQANCKIIKQRSAA